MGDRESAYAVLGLEPGANREAIEDAYRRLIKLYHPDRSGGDAKRAADINRAYFELRKPTVPRESVAAETPSRRHPGGKRRRSRSRRSLWPLMVSCGGLLLLMNGDRIDDLLSTWGSFAGPGIPGSMQNQPLSGLAIETSMDSPLAEAAIAHSVGKAVQMVNRDNAEAVVDQSRRCHRRMRANPELSQLDRCAAFDSAVAALEDRDPARDDGPFNASSVTARQMTAASLLSNDYLAIERRLDRIRTRVELTLAPRQPPLLVANETLSEGFDEIPQF